MPRCHIYVLCVLCVLCVRVHVLAMHGASWSYMNSCGSGVLSTSLVNTFASTVKLKIRLRSFRQTEMA